ncbi:MAG TPA: AMP-binding protein, partial [Blastocatellia bacterium]|nr:AMP-binding protein [Blastocatellia bacterium]
MNIPITELDFLKRAIAAFGEKEAIVCGKTRLSYNEFGQRTRRYANMIRGLGLEKGDRVAILSQNCH